MPSTDKINELLDIMKQLRDPDGGCPWDLEQTYKTIAPHTIEEAYELQDAVLREDMDDLKDELGDVLFQVIFFSQMASEDSAFTFNDVVEGVSRKMVERHPHIFGEESAEKSADVNEIWEKQKDKEKKRQVAESVLDDVPVSLPSLTRAQKIQKRAASAGFEWKYAEDVLDKMEEEIQEMREAIKNKSIAEMTDEIGDLFFVLTNFGRKLGINCEEASQQSIRKFTRRFKGMESALKKSNKTFKQLNLDEWEYYWNQEKQKEA